MKLVLTVAALATLFLCSRPVLACSCIGRTTVCAAVTEAEAVFVGTVMSVENQTAKDEEGKEHVTGQIARVQVDEAFKGAKASILTFRSYNTSCDVRYEEGQQWLFYAHYNEGKKSWAIGVCGRSTLRQFAAGDLLYLRNLPQSEQTTRISGRLSSAADRQPLSGVKVKLIGESKTYEVITDQNGVYEAYDLPAGKYAIEPETPVNLKLSLRMPPAASVVDDQKRLRVELKEKSCTGIDFVFVGDSSVNGTVFGANGLPMNHVCVRLWLKDNPKETPFLLGCTKEDGRFKIEEIGPGDYYLVANDDGVISSDEPFPLTYYPGVQEKEKATVLTIANGDKLQDFDIHIRSQQPTRTIEGRLLFSDGRPVDDGSIEFASEEKPGQAQDHVYAKTDAEGRFKISVLQGSKGTLQGRLYSFSLESAQCPQIDKLNKAYKDLETRRITLELNRDHANIELVFPFPFCPKAKKEGN